DRRGEAAVEEPVLLGEVVAPGQLDRDDSGLDARHDGADEAHRVLPPETVAHPPLEIGVGGLEAACRHAGNLGQAAWVVETGWVQLDFAWDRHHSPSSSPRKPGSTLRTRSP